LLQIEIVSADCVSTALTSISLDHHGVVRKFGFPPAAGHITAGVCAPAQFEWAPVLFVEGNDGVHIRDHKSDLAEDSDVRRTPKLLTRSGENIRQSRPSP